MSQSTKENNQSNSNFNFDGDDWFDTPIGQEKDEMTEVVEQVKNEKVETPAKKEATSGTTIEDDDEDFDFEAPEQKEEKEIKKDSKKDTKAGKGENKVDKKGDTEDEDDDDKDEGEDDVEEVDDKNKGGEEDDEDDDKKFFTTLAKEMKDRDIFQSVDLKDDEEIDEDKFFELHDKEIEARVTETFEAFFEEIDEDAKAFIEFKKNGGKTHEFFQAVAAPINLDVEFDEDNKKQVEETLRYYLTEVEELDADELEERMTTYKENGTEKARAAKFFKKLKDQKDKAKEELIERSKSDAVKREKQAAQFRQEIAEVISETEKVGIIPITKADKDLNDYINKPTVKVGKNKFISALQKDLATILKAATKEDKQQLIALSKAIKNKFKVKDTVVEVATQTTKKAKSALAQTKKGIKTGNAGGYKKRSLSDFFDE